MEKNVVFVSSGRIFGLGYFGLGGSERMFGSRRGTISVWLLSGGERRDSLLEALMIVIKVPSGLERYKKGRERKKKKKKKMVRGKKKEILIIV